MRQILRCGCGCEEIERTFTARNGVGKEARKAHVVGQLRTFAVSSARFSTHDSVVSHESITEGRPTTRILVSTYADSRDTRSTDSWLDSVARNPVVQTLGAMLVISTFTWASVFIGLSGLFILAPPLLNPPWALVTSVYAHAGPGHLLSNAVIVVLAGSFVAWSTTRLRFHLFFITTGALAGVAEVLIGGLFGPPTAVLGASGAAFALVGYVLTGNPASVAVLDQLRVPPRVLLVIVAVVAGALTIAFSAPGSALIAHLTGAILGLVAGRFRVLRVPSHRR